MRDREERGRKLSRQTKKERAGGDGDGDRKTWSTTGAATLPSRSPFLPAAGGPSPPKIADRRTGTRIARHDRGHGADLGESLERLRVGAGKRPVEARAPGKAGRAAAPAQASRRFPMAAGTHGIDRRRVFDAIAQHRVGLERRLLGRVHSGGLVAALRGLFEVAARGFLGGDLVVPIRALLALLLPRLLFDDGLGLDAHRLGTLPPRRRLPLDRLGRLVGVLVGGPGAGGLLFGGVAQSLRVALGRLLFLIQVAVFLVLVPALGCGTGTFLGILRALRDDLDVAAPLLQRRSCATPGRTEGRTGRG